MTQDTNLNLEFDSRLREIQSSVAVYFKSQRYWKLQEEIKSLGNKDPNKKRWLLLDQKSIHFDPTTQESVPQLDTIHAQVLELHRELEDRKDTLLVMENDLAASMLCEVSRLNLLNILKVFEVEMRFSGDESVPSDDNGARDESISHIREEIFLLRTGLKEKQSIITKYERQQGIGLKVCSLLFSYHSLGDEC